MMITIDIQEKHVRTAAWLMLLGGFLTAGILTVFHAMQDDAFLIDLVMPPALTMVLLIGLVHLYRHPENSRKIIQIAIVAGGILICIPAWYFSILAAGSPDITLVEDMPPITTIFLPIVMSIAIFLQSRTAIILMFVTWAAFITPILTYLIYHPEELMSPRGMEMLVTIGPVMFMVAALVVVSQGMKREVSQLYIERSDLKTLAEQDVLTGLYNRRAGEALLSKIIELTDTRFGIIMLDIDHFKHINDTHGHDVGDAALKELVRRCKKRIRSRDLFVRWGGEEFFIFVPDADKKETAQIAEQLREIISTEPMDTGLVVTASFGVTDYNRMDTPKSLLKRVDKALYEAKTKGRDRVVIR